MTLKEMIRKKMSVTRSHVYISDVSSTTTAITIHPTVPTNLKLIIYP